MKLEGSSDRLYKDKTSEIGEKYSISRDKIYLYFNGYNCEMLVNDELFKGNVHTIEALSVELQKALEEKQAAMSERNRKTPYKSYIYTNHIIRASKAFGVTNDNSELVYAAAGKHTKGHIMKIIMINRPFILVNAQPLACNALDKIEAEGVYKIKEILDFNCEITGLELHHLGQTIGRNIEKMEGILIRECRKKDPSFYFPRLFSFNNMRKAQWEGQIVRNYNLLQCANMAGLLQFDPEESFKVIQNVISFDIKTAYMSVMINQPLFPGDLTVIDIDPKEKKRDYMGITRENTPYSVAEDIVKRLARFETSNRWYYVAIDPCYFGDNEVVLQFLKTLQPFRRNFKTHSGVNLKYVNQNQMVCFLEYDKKFYEEYYSIYTELSFEELLYNLLLICPDAKIVLMYSKSKSDYLPKPFRDSKMNMYFTKESQSEDTKKKAAKMLTETTYGKGLQLRDYQTDAEVMKAVCNETVNIAISLTCCSYTRYRLVHDWQGFTPLYLDSDSIKFKFSPDTNRLADLVKRQQELNDYNAKQTAAAGYPESNLGSWNVDGVYNRLLILKKKCYVGFKNDATTEIKLAGCDPEAAYNYFKDATLKDLQAIEQAQMLIIPDGIKQEVIIDNNEFAYKRAVKDICYKK